ncbi:metallophosphoesterase [Coralliovum pocilloporae]|uniref:metallophosphoesterase n=1 Tax=Coralliovum pocilloporae TaxID=3066369 RepID=UPI003307C192
MSDGLKIVWLSDPHLLPEGETLYDRDPAACLEKAVAHVVSSYGDADLCVLTGDLANHGAPESYHLLQRILSPLPMPHLLLPGNHDLRSTLLTEPELAETDMDGFVQWSRSRDGLRLIGLDTLVEHKPYGHLCEERLAWLKAELEEAEAAGEKALIFLHHPPLDLGLKVMDTIRLDNGEAFLGLLNTFSCVRHLFFGHSHRTVGGTINGIAYSGLGSTLFQGPLSWKDTDLSSFQPTDEPPVVGLILASTTGTIVHYEQL